MGPAFRPGKLLKLHRDRNIKGKLHSNFSAPHLRKNTLILHNIKVCSVSFIFLSFHYSSSCDTIHLSFPFEACAKELCCEAKGVRNKELHETFLHSTCNFFPNCRHTLCRTFLPLEFRPKISTKYSRKIALTFKQKSIFA